MKRILIVLLAISAQFATAQFYTVGNGLFEEPEYAVVTTETDSSLLAAYVSSVQPNTIFVEEWNGLFWRQLPTLSGKFVHDIATFNNEIYLSITQGSTGGLVRFTNGSWTNITPPTFNGTPGVLETDNASGRLLIAGNFDVSGLGLNDLMSFDGNTFSGFPNLPKGNWLNFDTLTDISIIQNEIWVAGFRSYQDTLNVFKFDATTNSWGFPASFYQGTNSLQYFPVKVFEHQNQVYVASGRQFFTVSNDTATLIPGVNLPVVNQYSQSKTGTVLFNSSSTVASSNIIGGVNSLTFGAFTRLNNLGFSFGVGFLDSTRFVFPKQNVVNGIAYNHAARTNRGLALLQGRIYIDNNANCNYDVNIDVGLPNTLVGLNNSNILSSNVSQSNGQYSLALIPGSYPLQNIVPLLATYKNVSLSCSPPNSISLSSQQVLTLDLAFTPPTQADLSITINAAGGARARQGFVEYYDLDLTNLGIDQNGQISVTLELPANTNLLQATPAAASNIGKVYTWNFNGLNAFETKGVSLTMRTPISSSNIGDTLIFYANITNPGITTDADSSDNKDTLVQELVAAYDPNDKQVSKPVVSPGTRKLDYQIRFQNTGNDTAYRVVVVDTLDTTLPISKIIMNSASHSYSIGAQNNILIWTFDNILLPDSTTDLAGSQGYIRFSAEIDPSLGVGDSVINDAQIYFDYQKPIYTNVAKTLILENIGLPEKYGERNLNIYPNPATEHFIIENTSNKNQKLKIVNTQGRFIEESILKAGEKMEVNTEKIPNGIYFITVGNSYYRLIIKYQ
jgi:uncharacterized repeat protein (TIGR01451 family)